MVRSVGGVTDDQFCEKGDIGMSTIFWLVLCVALYAFGLLTGFGLGQMKCSNKGHDGWRVAAEKLRGMIR